MNIGVMKSNNNNDIPVIRNYYPIKFVNTNATANNKNNQANSIPSQHFHSYSYSHSKYPLNSL